MIKLKDREGKAYKIKCIEVLFITSVEKQPNLEKIRHLFPSLPKDSFIRPNMEVGVLLGQYANCLLPTGGSGPHKVEGLRVQCTVLGKLG